MNDILKVQNVSKIYQTSAGERTILKELNMNVKEGALTILQGPSGSGKTTLLNIIGALESDYEGDIIFENKSYSSMTEKQLRMYRKNELGFVFQSYALSPVMTAAENIDFALRFLGDRDYNSRNERIKWALNLVGMEKRAAHLPKELSGGERQRISIAKAIALRPKLLIADEPTSALDTENGLRLIALLKRLIREENLTVIMTSHDPGIIELGDYVYMLRDGEIVNG